MLKINLMITIKIEDCSFRKEKKNHCFKNAFANTKPLCLYARINTYNTNLQHITVTWNIHSKYNNIIELWNRNHEEILFYQLVRTHIVENLFSIFTVMSTLHDCQKEFRCIVLCMLEMKNTMEIYICDFSISCVALMMLILLK